MFVDSTEYVEIIYSKFAYIVMVIIMTELITIFVWLERIALSDWDYFGLIDSGSLRFHVATYFPYFWMFWSIAGL